MIKKKNDVEKITFFWFKMKNFYGKWKNSKIFSMDSERAPSKIVGYEFLWKNSTGFIELHSVKLSSTKNYNYDVKGLRLFKAPSKSVSIASMLTQSDQLSNSFKAVGQMLL